MRQNPMAGRWRSTGGDEAEHRRAIATRLGLSEFASMPGPRSNPDTATYDADIPTLSFLPATSTMDLSFNTARSSFPGATARMGTGHTRGGAGGGVGGGGGSNRLIHRGSGDLEVAAATSGHYDGEIDVFHDCINLEETSATFSNMFDDLDLEGPESGVEGRDEAAAAAAAAAAGAGMAAFVPPPSMHRGGGARPPSFNPVAAAATGNGSSRGSSCKRKSSASDGLSMRHDDVAGNHHVADLASSQRSAFILPPPSGGGGGGGASSSRSAALMEGPRPQKTRLSSDALDSTLGSSLFTSSRVPDFAGLSSTSSSMHPSQVYPRGVRRTFPAGPDSFRVRRNALLDCSAGPDAAAAAAAAAAAGHGHLTFSGSAVDPGASMAFSGARAARLHGSSGMGSQGLSRRIARMGSGRSVTSNASPREQAESRIRSISMACLENGTFTSGSSRPAIRRGVANYLPALGARHAPVGDARQLHGYSGRAGFYSHGGGRSLAHPQVPGSILESPELRPPPPYEGSQSFRQALAVGRRDLSSLTEGFMAIPAPEHDWDHHRPRLMAGGLAEILQALERVERDEDLTREQLIMLEATTFLFGGIGLHDDHSDWRLDIDNMSYEELLALGDRIGTVSTGLTEETIVRQLKKTKYAAAGLARSMEDSDVKCSICQEEFDEGAELGMINCGHNYHMDCIGQWLLRKNSCPICKATALPQ